MKDKKTESRSQEPGEEKEKGQRLKDKGKRQKSEYRRQQ
jgi:hypothetical protein